MKNEKLHITEEEKIKAHKTASRNVELDLGMRRPTHKIHISKKKYNRKRLKKIDIDN